MGVSFITPRRALGVLAVPVAVGLFLAVSHSDIQAGIDSANDLLYRKQYVDAERLYRKLLKRLDDAGQLSDNEEAQRLVVLDRLGKVNAIYIHDYEQATAFLNTLVRLYPRTDQALAARALIADVYHHKLGDLPAAIDAYHKLVSEFPSSIETRRAQLQIATAYFQLRNFEQARTEAEQLINAWPATDEALQARFQIANSYYVEGRYAEAIATYELLLEGKPDKQLASLVLFELGNCFQEVGEMERALSYYYACLPDHPDPQLVQRKIRRVRVRIHKVKPSIEIHYSAGDEARGAVGSSSGQPPVQAALDSASTAFAPHKTATPRPATRAVPPAQPTQALPVAPTPVQAEEKVPASPEPAGP